MQELSTRKFHGITFLRDGTKQLRTVFDWRMTHTYSSYVCECACRWHQCCQLLTTRIFGTFSFYGQLSDKRSNIPLGATYRVREQRASGVKQQSCTRFLGPRYLDLLQCIRPQLALRTRAGMSAVPTLLAYERTNWRHRRIEAIDPKRLWSTGGNSSGFVHWQRQQIDLLLLVDLNVGPHEAAWLDARVGGCKRLAVRGDHDCCHLDQFACLHGGGDQRVRIDTRVAPCVVVGTARQRVGLPIINVDEHCCCGVPLRVHCLDGALNILPILLVGVGSTPERCASELRFLDIELPRPYQRIALREP